MDARMIPNDMMIDILIWLPVVSLLRFKLVCKSWHSLIESSHFVSQHLQLSNKKRNPESKLFLLTLSHVRDMNNRYCPFNFDFISFSDLQLSKYVQLIPPPNIRYLKYGGELITSFNGIICLKYRTMDAKYSGGWVDVVYLWNPATNQLRILPPPQYDIKTTKYDRGNFEYGFGFDAKTNDYKVVRFFTPKFPDNGSLIKRRVEVYSLITDSWRTIDAVPPPNVCHIICSPRKPFQDEIYCWKGYYHKSLIISFNFSSETFGIIPMPEFCAGDSIKKRLLAYLRGKIACIDLVYSDPQSLGSRQCRVWVMEEYGIKESWTKLYTVTLDDHIIWNVAFFMEGKIVLRTDDNRLCVYDLGSEEINGVTIQGGLILGAVEYKESLVSVKRANGVTDTGSALGQASLDAGLGSLIYELPHYIVGASN